MHKFHFALNIVVVYMCYESIYNFSKINQTYFENIKDLIWQIFPEGYNKKDLVLLVGKER